MSGEELSANGQEESSQTYDSWVGLVGKTVWKPHVANCSNLLKGQRPHGGLEYYMDWPWIVQDIGCYAHRLL